MIKPQVILVDTFEGIYLFVHLGYDCIGITVSFVSVRVSCICMCLIYRLFSFLYIVSYICVCTFTIISHSHSARLYFSGKCASLCLSLSRKSCRIIQVPTCVSSRWRQNIKVCVESRLQASTHFLCVEERGACWEREGRGEGARGLQTSII